MMSSPSGAPRAGGRDARHDSGRGPGVPGELDRAERLFYEENAPPRREARKGGKMASDCLPRAGKKISRNVVDTVVGTSRLPVLCTPPGLPCCSGRDPVP